MDELKKAKTGAARWLSRAANLCEELIPKISEVEVGTYDSTLDNFKKRLSAWEEKMVAVQEATNSEDQEELFESDASYIEKMEASKTALENAWRKAHSPSANQLSSAASSASSASSAPVRLPKLDLPKFNGDVLEFSSFWQLFTASVDLQDIPDVSKMTYLLSLLKGEAKNSLKGMPVTSQSYVDAKKILERRYGRKELIIHAHIQQLLSLPSTDSDLRPFVDKLVANVRALGALDITADQYGVILTPIVVSRLSPHARDEWSRVSEGHEGDLNHLIGFLEKELRRQERSNTVLSTTSSETPSRGNRHPSKQNSGSATSLFSNQKKAKCTFCKNNDHFPNKCSSFKKLTLDERQKLVIEKKLCRLCFKSSHFARKCQWSPCKKCDGLHNGLLCDKKEESSRSHSDSVTSSCQSEKVDSSNDENVVKSNVTVNVNQNSVFLLPLARVKVLGREGPVDATLLFDSGSDRSYVARDLVSRVHPKWVRTQQNSFSTFGGRSHGAKSKVYSLDLSPEGTNDKKVGIDLAEVPVICLPLPRPVVDPSVLGNFDHLDLAYDCRDEDDVSIDILIGQDLFWSLMIGNCFRDEKSGVVAQESVFGWVLSGNCSGSSKGGVTLLNLTTIPDRVAKTFWDLESLGIKNEDESIDPVLDTFNRSIEYNDETGHYKVPLMWKNNKPPLQDNREKAYGQFCNLERKLDRNPSLKSGYNDALSEMEAKGVIAEVTEKGDNNKVHYLPHHPHVRETSSTTKVSPVIM